MLAFLKEFDYDAIEFCHGAGGRGLDFIGKSKNKEIMTFF
jgi:hypothetical protein